MPDADRSEVVLLLIDVINPFDYAGGERVLANALRVLPEMISLKSAFAELGLATLYVNDNFGRWRSSFAETVQYCLARSGRSIVEGLVPDEHDYFVLKPHRSGFYGTALDILLERLGARVLVCAGIATDMCVMATASDAQMRGYLPVIVRDGTATVDTGRHERALDVMSHGVGALLESARGVIDKLGTGAARFSL